LWWEVNPAFLKPRWSYAGNSWLQIGHWSLGFNMGRIRGVGWLFSWKIDVGGVTEKSREDWFLKERERKRGGKAIDYKHDLR
jgi:hypothetical protein